MVPEMEEENTRTKDTLLRPFLQQRLAECGVSPGIPGNFSWKKYASCLLMVTDLSLKDISWIIGVSYGVLRKWRTEIPFRQMMDLNESEYLDLFDLFLTEMLKTPYQKEEVILSSWQARRGSSPSDAEEAAASEALVVTLDSLAGYGVNPGLKASMMRLFLKRYQDNSYLVTFFRYPAISGLIDVGTGKECDQVLVPFLNMCIDWCLGRLTGGLDGPSEKKVLAFTLNKMKEYLSVTTGEPQTE